MKTECDYSLYGWIKKKQKMVTYANISPRMVNARDVAWNTEEEVYRDLSFVQAVFNKILCCFWETT